MTIMEDMVDRITRLEHHYLLMEYASFDKLLRSLREDYDQESIGAVGKTLLDVVNPRFVGTLQALIRPPSTFAQAVEDPTFACGERFANQEIID